MYSSARGKHRENATPDGLDVEAYGGDDQAGSRRAVPWAVEATPMTTLETG